MKRTAQATIVAIVIVYIERAIVPILMGCSKTAINVPNKTLYSVVLLLVAISLPALGAYFLKLEWRTNK